MKLQVVYDEERSEVVEFPLTHKLQDLREYFNAEAVEILSRSDEAVTNIPLARDMAVIRSIN